MKKRQIKSTDKATNLCVDILEKLSLDDMQSVLVGLCFELGLEVSHITRLSPRKYPGNRHWHFKEDLQSRGCLDVTYWPQNKLLWITCRHYEPAWVHSAGSRLQTLLQAH